MKSRSPRLKSFAAVLVLACGAVFTGGLHAEVVPIVLAEWDVELLSMDLNARAASLPLGPEWTLMQVDVHFGSATDVRSIGRTTATRLDQQLPGPIQDGETVLVQSFFDVYFDIRITDADLLLDFRGMPDGAAFNFFAVGPGRIESTYQAKTNLQAPNWGLFPPPESAPYVGAFDLEMLLDADLNGNGEDDKIKLSLLSLQAREAGRTFITLPDDTVIDSFDAAVDFSGAVVDASQDPPFGPITLTGPTTASSQLNGPTLPEPGSFGLLALGLALASVGRHRRG